MDMNVKSEMSAPPAASEATRNVRALKETDAVASSSKVDEKQGGREPAPFDRSDKTQKQIERLQEAVTRINSHPQVVNRQLSFEIEGEKDLTIVKVIDKDTDEVIRQLPPEEVVERAEFMERLEGVIFRSKA